MQKIVNNSAIMLDEYQLKWMSRLLIVTTGADYRTTSRRLMWTCCCRQYADILNATLVTVFVGIRLSRIKQRHLKCHIIHFLSDYLGQYWK